MQLFKDQDDFRYVQIVGYSLSALADEAKRHHADVMYNDPDGRLYYVPADAAAFVRAFRRSAPAELNKLSTEKKLDMLLALNQECYMSQKIQENRDIFLEDNGDKLHALLNLRIPPIFLGRRNA